ncbi:MAG: hypothetical protein CME65_11915 [Halobacteriovoraceae bacterium]|nr:hypothetical protein [Halobacteriovoraceae bacterium]
MFVVFSYIFLFLQYSYQNSLSIITHEELVSYALNKKIIGILFLSTMIFVFRLSKVLSLFYWLMVATTVSVSLNGLWVEFSKLIILLLFFYIVFSYYLYQFLKEDLNESYYNPQFDEGFLFKPMCKQIPVRLKKGDQEKVIECHLTNWSEGGFFVFLNESTDLRGLYSVFIDYNGHEFETQAKIVARLKDDLGYGLKIYSDKSDTPLSWSKFLNIIYEMGYQPELLV